MKTWKSKRLVCRRTKNGRFARKGACKTFRRTKVKCVFGKLFQ